MSLLGEEIVQEWLNRKGYFTIRGIKVGVHELDILAIKPLPNGGHECRHIEVTISVNPISYISRVPKEVQKRLGRHPNSAKKRERSEIQQGVAEWIKRKFDHKDKIALRSRLCPGKWTRELVLHEVKHPEEIEVFKEAGITVFRLRDIIEEMKCRHSIIAAAAGASLYEMVLLSPGHSLPAAASTATIRFH